ncbi:MAG: sulfatase-like hydrolase/transferase [Chitinophagales bacterium]
MCCARATGQVADPPNILFIEFDDLNDYVEGLGGQLQVETPNWKYVENLGTLFLNAYTAAPQCGPSRACMLTGKDCFYTGIYNNLDYKCNDFRGAFRPMYNNETVFTLPEWLKDSGNYFTYELNKINHCDDKYNDYDDVTADPCAKELSWNKVFYYDDSADIVVAGEADLGGGERLRWSMLNDTMEKYMGDYIAVDSAIDFLYEYTDDPSIACGRPFFLAVGLKKPHVPYFIPQKYFPEYMQMDVFAEPFRYPYNYPENAYPYNGIIMPPQPAIPFQDYENLPEDGVARQLTFYILLSDILDYPSTYSPWPLIDPTLTDEERYAILGRTNYANGVMAYMAAITYADAQLGRLLDALEAQPEIYNNTILVLVSDHGFSLGEKHHMFKGAMWETDLRIPMLIADLRNPQQQVAQQTVSLLDIFPTICAMAGIAYPAFPDGSPYLDGKSLLPIMNDPEMIWERPVISTYEEKKETSQGGCFPQYSIRDARFHYIKYATNNVYGNLTCNIDSSLTEEELYDIGLNRETDPNEWNNLANDPDYAPVINYLQQFLPDSALYLQNTFSVNIYNDSLPCLLTMDDTLHAYIHLFDTLGLELPDDTTYTVEWTNNLTGDVFTGNALNFPLALIPEDVFDAQNTCMVYVAVYDNGGQLIAFDTKTYFINPDSAPMASFHIEMVNDYQAAISDLLLEGNYTHYWWDLGEGPVYYDQTPSVVTYDTTGYHEVTLFVQYGNASCELEVTYSVYTELTPPEQFSLHLFPNPASAYCSLEMRDVQKADIRILDVHGIRVDQYAYSGLTPYFTFSVKDLPGGMYFVSVQNEKYIRTEKLLIIH